MQNNKDKRISWLSIFSSLTQINIEKTDTWFQDIVQKAFDINEELYKNYPLEEEVEVKTEETDERCKICNFGTIIKSGESNKGKWRGVFCQNPDCGKVRWLPKELVDESAYLPKK